MKVYTSAIDPWFLAAPMFWVYTTNLYTPKTQATSEFVQETFYYATNFKLILYLVLRFLG